MLNEKELIKKISNKAKEFRKEIVEVTCRAKQAHIGSALSCADIIATLYFGILKVNPRDPKSKDRDRFILSKGHGCLALYSALAGKKFFKKGLLYTFNQFKSILGGHPDMLKIPGVEASTGSLGHGLSIGLGMALAGKVDCKDYRVFVLLGDGECEEGSVWEASMAAAHLKVDNLVVIVDNNGIQLLDFTDNILSSLKPLGKKFKAFGWLVKEIDGHNIKEILKALRSVPFKKGKPSCIIAHTVKGKGISFMENQPRWHYRGLTEAERVEALKELSCISHRSK